MRLRMLTVALMMAWAVDAHAQRILYDQTRDTTAQQTVTAVEAITSGALFDTMLRNVDAQAKMEADAMLAAVREQMRAKLIAVDAWFIDGVNPIAFDQPDPVFERNARFCPTSVDCVLRELRAKHQAALAGPVVTQAELTKKLADLKAKVTALEAELKALREASQAKGDSRLEEAFAALQEHGKPVLEFANTLVTEIGKDEGRFKGASKALDEIGKGLDQVIKVYQITRDIWTSRALVTVDPASLRPPPQHTEIQLLLVEQSHLDTRARIEAKRQMEVSAALRIVEDAMQALRIVDGGSVEKSTARIEDTLRSAAGLPDRTRLKNLLTGLYLVAAAASQMEAADQLAGIRQADELRRFSIRRSAIIASTYEVALRAAAQRLAAYWKRGLKPTDLVELAAWIANTAALIEVANDKDE